MSPWGCEITTWKPLVCNGNCAISDRAERSQIPQIANGIIWLIGDFRLTVKKGKDPDYGAFFWLLPSRLRQDHNRSGYFRPVGKADSSQCGFCGSVAAKDDAFATSGSP